MRVIASHAFYGKPIGEVHLVSNKIAALLVALMLVAAAPGIADGPAPEDARTAPDPAAKLMSPDDASEYWTLYVELESGHRITQRFGLTNAGPGEHTAVAVGHLLEPGRAPYRYANGRRRSRWTLSDDRLFFDIAASHLDLHRPTGELRITKDDIEIRLFFDFAESDLAASVPAQALPPHYGVDVLAVGAPTRGSIKAPWMAAPLETTGRTWMAHTWSYKDEAKLLTRRVEVFGGAAESIGGRAFFGLQFRHDGGRESAWSIARSETGFVIESTINQNEVWTESGRAVSRRGSKSYPLSGDFTISGTNSGSITLTDEVLRYDPLEVIPNPFRWLIRRMTEPQEVWAEAVIDGTLFDAPMTPSLPQSVGANGSETGTDSNVSGTGPRSERETEQGSAERRVAGVAFITFMNPADRR